MLVPSAFAANERRKFVEGGELALSLSEYTQLSGGSCADGTLSLNAGSAKYEFTLPFYSNKLVIKSPSAGQTVTVKINDVTEIITLSGAETEHSFDITQRVGEKDFIISSTGNVSITSVIFKEIAEIRSVTPKKLETSKYEDATSTAVILNEQSPVIKVNSAARYIDYDDTSARPRYINGSLFIPADTLAQALSCYFEEKKEKNFFVIRKGNKEITYINGKYSAGIDGDFKDFGIELSKVGGKTYLPLRPVAEFFDYYVNYKDSFVVCDYRSRTRTILNDFYSELTKDFEEYIQPTTAGKTYYVSKEANASDSNVGTIDAPFATIAHASEIAEAGDTVIIRAGVYSELLKPKNNGTAVNPITYKAMEGEEVTLSALEEISNFAEYKDGIWVASVPWNLGLGRNQVFLNGKNLVEARYPNDDIDFDGFKTLANGLKADPIWITNGDIKVEYGNTQYAVSDTLLQEEEGYWDGAVFVTQQGAAWTLCSAIVEHSTPGRLKLKDFSDKWWFKAEPEHPNYGYLTCHVNAIDKPGEWTIKNNMLYIMPPKCAQLDTFKVDVKKNQLVMDLADSSYIHVEGIKTLGGGVRMNDSKMCVINNCDMRYISHYTYFKDNRDLCIEDGVVTSANNAPARGEVGIYIGGENNAVINSSVHFSAGAGMFIVGSYAYIANNVLSDMGYGGTSVGAIEFNTQAWKSPTTKRGGHTVVHNTISMVARQAVSYGHYEANDWAATSFLPTEIAYNEASDCSVCTLDTGVLYSWGSSVGDNEKYTSVHNNYIYTTSTKNPPLLGAIYWDNWMMSANTFDNLIWAEKSGQYNNDVYEQHTGFATSYSTVDSWNNINLGIKNDGKNELALSDFRSVKPFIAGSSKTGYTNDFTYEYYANGDSGIHLAKNAVLSDGVKLENNRAKFTAENQWVKFENVNFDDGNYINVVYSGDYYTNFDKWQIVVGDTLTDGKTVDFTMNAESKSLMDFNTVGASVAAFELTGNHTVWVKAVTAGNASLYQLHLTNTVTNESYDYDYKRIEAGTFAMYGGEHMGENPPSPKNKFAIDGFYSCMIGTWKGYWVKYPKVTVDKYVDNFYIYLASSKPWDGNEICLRLGSPDGEVIARAENLDNDWQFEKVEVPLTRSLSAGTYDLYLTFEGADNGCSDVYCFGLY